MGALRRSCLLKELIMKIDPKTGQRVDPKDAKKGAKK